MQKENETMITQMKEETAKITEKLESKNQEIVELQTKLSDSEVCLLLLEWFLFMCICFFGVCICV